MTLKVDGQKVTRIMSQVLGQDIKSCLDGQNFIFNCVNQKELKFNIYPLKQQTPLRPAWKSSHIFQRFLNF